MRVLFQTRTDIFKRRGGDTVQVENTAEELKKLGVIVDFSSDNKKNLNDYDVVHIFQLDWIAEPFLQALNAKNQHKPLVLSPIHHSEEEVAAFEKYDRYDFRRLVNLVMWDQESKDVMKNIYRSFIEFNTGKMIPTLLSIFNGFRKQQKDTIQMCDILLVQTEEEAKDLKKDFGTTFKWKKVVNGVGNVFINPTVENFNDEKDYVVTVGRIEARKNQLRVIEAVKKFREESGKDVKLVVVGQLNKRNPEYYFHFKRKVKEYPWISYYPKVAYEKMPSVYRNAKVCVSASWFETTGLTLLEAAMCGCNVVSSSGPTGNRVKEYLENDAFYCDRVDIDSIKSAISKAYNAKRPEVSPEFKEKYTWTAVAKETLKVYNGLINGSI